MLRYHFGYEPHGPARRGKRLRPRLLMTVAQAEGGETRAALDAAAAIEILHNYSLVHDDIEDHDELRHGRKTLWAVYGIPQALNAGDAMCALSFLVLMNARGHHRDERVLAMVHALNDAHSTMCDGQSLDLAFERRAHVSLPEYREMIAAKTAALFGASSELGALCAPCDTATVRAYREIGIAYGLAFQIQDDLMGIWAPESATGKVSGNDIARRKWTFPVVWALQQPDSAARACIAQAYAAGGALDAAVVERVIDALNALGAQEAARAAMAEHVGLVERHPVQSVRDLLLSTLAVEASR